MTLVLGSCLRSNDAWGAGRRGLMVVECPLRVPSGQASTGSGRTDLGSAPTTGSRGCNGVGVGMPCPAPLWIPAFAGKTIGVWGAARDGDAPVHRPCPGFPQRRERRWGCAGRTMGVCGPASAGGHGGVKVPLRRDGRFANRPYGGLGELGMRRGFGWGCPARRPSGFLPAQESRGGVGAAGADGVGRPPSSALSNCYGWQGGVGSRGSGGGRWR